MNKWLGRKLVSILDKEGARVAPICMGVAKDKLMATQTRCIECIECVL